MRGGAPPAVPEAGRALAAGRALWREGLVPEASAQLVRGLRALLGAWVPAQERTSVAEGELAALAALESAGYRHLDSLRTTLADESTGDFERLWTATETLRSFTAQRLQAPVARRRARLRLAAALVLGVAGLSVVAIRLWGRPTTSASAVYSGKFPAAHAVDGLVATEWLLPDRTTGWVQLIFSSARRVRGVRLYNAHNSHFLDRGAERVRVTAFLQTREVARADGRFPEISPGPASLDLTLDAPRVTHLRVEVLSHFKMGGGLAEIEVR
jgi:hypothetical protein